MRLPRALRRVAIILMYAAYLAGAVAQWRLHAPDANQQIVWILFLMAFGIGVALFATTHYLSWSGAKNTLLDEREIATRDSVYRQAYGIIAWVSVGILMLWYAAPLLASPLMASTNGNVLVWGYVLLISTLPAALLAWNDRAVV